LRKLQQNRITIKKAIPRGLDIFPASCASCSQSHPVADNEKRSTTCRSCHCRWSGTAGGCVAIAGHWQRHSIQRPAAIFEPFYTTKKENGTGLGLWLAYGIAQKHTGTIRVASRTLAGHSGTVFSVFLPESPAIAATQAA
jgi:hypothetical protein